MLSRVEGRVLVLPVLFILSGRSNFLSYTRAPLLDLALLDLSVLSALIPFVD